MRKKNFGFDEFLKRSYYRSLLLRVNYSVYYYHDRFIIIIKKTFISLQLRKK